MRISPIEYKSQIRDSINNIFTIEFKIVRRIFPILLGVYKALYFKYQDNTVLLTHEKIFLSCFQKNLPGIETEHKKIVGQTFDEVFIGELKTGGNKTSSEQRDRVTDKLFIPNYFTSSERNFQEDRLSNFLDFDQHGQTGIQTNFYSKKTPFYNNATIIYPSFNWNKKQKKLYLGLFSNKSQPRFVDKSKKNARRYQLENNWSNIEEKKFYNYLSYFPSISIPSKQLVKGKLLTRQYKKFAEFSNRESAIQQNSKFYAKHKTKVRRPTPSTFFNFRSLQAVNKLEVEFKNQTNKILLLNKHIDPSNKIYSNLDEVPVKLNSKYILDPKTSWNFLRSGSSVPKNILVDSPTSSIFLMNKPGTSQSVRKILSEETLLGERSYGPLAKQVRGLCEPSEPPEGRSYRLFRFGPFGSTVSSEVGLAKLQTTHYNRVAKQKYSVSLAEQAPTGTKIFSNAKIEQLKKKKFKVESVNELKSRNKKNFSTLKIFFIRDFFRIVSEKASPCWKVVLRNPGVVARSYKPTSQERIKDFSSEPASVAKQPEKAKQVGRNCELASLENRHLEKTPQGSVWVSYAFFVQPSSMDLQGVACNPNILQTPGHGKRKANLLLNKIKTKRGYFNHFIKQYSSIKNITWVADGKIIGFIQGIKPSQTLRKISNFSNLLTYPQGVGKEETTLLNPYSDPEWGSLAEEVVPTPNPSEATPNPSEATPFGAITPNGGKGSTDLGFMQSIKLREVFPTPSKARVMAPNGPEGGCCARFSWLGRSLNRPLSFMQSIKPRSLDPREASSQKPQVLNTPSGLNMPLQIITNSKKKVFKLKKNSFFLSEPASSEQALKSLKILENYTSLNKNIIISPRRMSGYKLPDSTTKLALLEFKKKLRFKKIHDSYTIDTPKNSFLNFMPSIKLTHVEPYKDYLKLDSSFASIPFKLLSEKLELKYKERPSYNGPAIFENEITHELQITNSTELKDSYKQFISSDNPLTDSQQSFFGKYFLTTKLMANEFNSNLFPPEIAIKKPLFIKKKYFRKFTTGLFSKNEARKLPVRREKKLHNFIVQSPNRIFSTKRFQYIAYLNQSEWDTFTAKLKTSDKLISPELGSINQRIFPFKSINQIGDGVIFRPLNQIDFTSGGDQTSLTQFFNSQSSGRITNQFQPVRLTQTEKQIFGKIYKKTNTVYTNKNFRNRNNVLEDNNNRFFKNNLSERTRLLRQIFYQPFEPISYSSFLYVSQRYSFLLFFMYIFKDILKKYQQEIKSFILGFINKQNSSNENETDNVQWDLRIIKNIKKNFDDIGGIDAILPELGEIVWFLRNSVESLPLRREKTKNTISKAILLTGPPGTGKTLLVQAIAGEAKVPVLIESASSLIQPSKSFNGPERIKNLFAKAREIAPCIIFIDEIDTFGETRSVMMENPIFHDPILDAIYPSSEKFKNNVTLTPSSSGLVNPLCDYHLTPKQNMFDQAKTSNDSQINSSQDKTSGPSSNKFKQTKTNLLMQLLIELDGVTNDKKVLVFAATNRPQILDSALIRPGRFNKTLDLKLPNKQKRIEIIKLYSGNMGVEKNISLDYIANLTIGLSAADLASAINQSSIQAIQNETIHTIDTLEYGIQNITGVGKTSQGGVGRTSLTKQLPSSTKGGSKSQKNKLRSLKLSESILKVKPSKRNIILTKQTNSVLKNRIAYYQAGKVVVHTLLQTHPNITSIHLWPEIKSLRHHLINGIREKQFSQIYRRVELESRVIGLYAGKAGELIGLFQKLSFDSGRNQKNKQVKIKANSLSFMQSIKPRQTSCPLVTHSLSLVALQSNLGIQDMSLASWLGEVMINRWHLYSKKLSTQNFNRLKKNYNQEQNADVAITGFLQKESFLLNSLYKNLQNNRREVTSLNVISTLKKRVKHPWLQKHISKKFEFLYSSKTDWYRIYSADHKEDENTRYVLPDIYYHSNIYLKKLKKYKFVNTKVLVNNKFSSIVNWNEVYSLNRDYIYQNLLSTCFNKALLLIDQNRELLDLFATSLLRKEILREYEIYDIIQGFSMNSTDVSPGLDLGLSFMQSIKPRSVDPKKAKTKLSQLLIKTKNISEVTNNGFEQNQMQNKILPNVTEVENMWGKESRRRICKFVNFQSMK